MIHGFHQQEMYLVVEEVDPHIKKLMVMDKVDLGVVAMLLVLQAQNTLEVVEVDQDHLQVMVVMVDMVLCML